MSAQYTRDHCKIALAKILQTIGWHSINSTPIEVLTDILSEYIKQIVKHTNDYATEFGQTEPNLDHLGLAFQELGINIHELEEYVTYVNFAPPPHPVPKYPIPKENTLNFLKPGSKEVVTRPVHVHEHLPPMYPLMEASDNEADNTVIKKENDEESSENQQFKKPSDIFSPDFKRPRREEEGSRPTREISSVMMTTSGFLSPAREGKLPEAKAPVPPPEPVRPPTPEPIMKKKVEKKKEKMAKELFKPIQEEKPVKKTPTIVKDVFKMKQQKPVLNPVSIQPPLMPNAPPLHPLSTNEVKISPIPPPKPRLSPKANFSKALAAAKAKTERLNTTITPIPVRPDMNPFPLPLPAHVDKLFTEPDKKKVNILKKISVKEKHEHKQPRQHINHHYMDDQLPSDIVSKINLSSDITIEPIMHPVMKTPDKIEMGYFDSASPPPRTPPTPRTPEILTHSPPILKEKRKRKEKQPRAKRVKKQPPFMEPELIDITMDRPKTPEILMRHHPHQPPFSIPPMAHHASQMPFPFPLPNFRGPGLIPPPLSNPLFPFMPNFGKNPYFAAMPPMEHIPPRSSPKIKELASPKIKELASPKMKELKPEPKPEPPVITPPEPEPRPITPQAPLVIEEPQTVPAPPQTSTKKSKEHKKEKKDKLKKKNKKEKVKEKGEKKKLKEGKKEKIKKEKKIKKKEAKEIIKEIENPIPKILLKVNSPSPRPETPETLKKLNIKPIVRKDDELIPEEKKREPSPGLAKISALVTGPPKQKTASPISHSVEKPLAEALAAAPAPRPPGRPRIHPVKQKPSPPKPKKVEQPFVKKDEQGNEVWICPACGQQDDGRPMIGCDGCDAWYHWVCVGIQVPPDENENWYCKPCLCKKNEDLQDKKRKRKKKEKKDN